MSLISQTTSYTTPGTHTYVVPQGVGSLEFHLWGAGGAAGGHGPASTIQTGTNVTQVQTGTTQTQTGTVSVQTGTALVQTGTKQVQIGTKQEAYTVSVAQTNSKGATVNSKGQPTGGKGQPAVTYTTVTQYRTVPVYETQPVYTVQPVYADQPTYTSDIIYTTVDTPIYSSTIGGDGAAGAGGGYSSRKIQVHQGDVIVISVGSAGSGVTGGQSILSPTNFNGGNSGIALNGARGGGGGAATVITVNGVVVAVAAGGGGGGGGGISGQVATAGTAATISGVGSGTQGSGISSVTGSATGGGGGGGYYSGLAGTSGNSGGGAHGGVCYGTVIQGGSGIIPGGISLPQYPGHNIGYATYSGAAILIFNKSFNINIKHAGNWNPVNSAWVKVNGNWKGIANGWTKVSGVWKPLISPSAVSGSENLITPAITYSLTADATSIAENDSVTFTLATTGISAGTLIPYTATGIAAYDLDAGTLSGNFVVGTADSITFTPKVNHVTNGVRTLRVSIDNTNAAETCTITDTSTTPLYTITGNVTSMNEGDAVRFTLSSANGVNGTSIQYAVTGITSSRIASGSDSLTGTFVFGSADTVDFGVINDYTTTGTSTMKITLIGKGSFATCSVVDTSTTPSGSIAGTTSGTSWTVPAGVYSASVTAIGAGGGGGGCDSHAGYNGYAGDKITGTIAVTPGQVYTLYSGTAGAGGGSDQGSAPGGAGGTGYASGGAGSAAGPSPYSGGGGGGGAAAVLLLASTPILVAAGGGGGGGGGNGSTGQAQQGNYASGTAGGNGTAKGGDGGGAGGGGSGYPLGGGGGAVRSGDSGGYSGTNGQHVVPVGCSIASANNGGGAAVRNSIAARSGGNGSIIVSW